MRSVAFDKNNEQWRAIIAGSFTGNGAHPPITPRVTQTFANYFAYNEITS